MKTLGHNVRVRNRTRAWLVMYHRCGFHGCAFNVIVDGVYYRFSWKEALKLCRPRSAA